MHRLLEVRLSFLRKPASPLRIGRGHKQPSSPTQVVLRGQIMINPILDHEVVWHGLLGWRLLEKKESTRLANGEALSSITV